MKKHFCLCCIFKEISQIPKSEYYLLAAGYLLLLGVSQTVCELALDGSWRDGVRKDSARRGMGLGSGGVVCLTL